MFFTLQKIEALRAYVRSLDFVALTDTEVERFHINLKRADHNTALEGNADNHALAKSINHLPQAMALSDRATLFDNTGGGNVRLATIKHTNVCDTC